MCAHLTAHGARVVAGHLPLSTSRPTRPVVRDVRGALAVPPELALKTVTKVRPSSRTDFDVLSTGTSVSAEGDSTDEHGLLFSPPGATAVPTSQ